MRPRERVECLEVRINLSYPEIVQVLGSGNPFNAIDVGDISAPALADFDSDGDLDAVVGEYNGTLLYYRNTGTASAPLYVQQIGGANPFNGVDVGRTAAPAVGDVDGNGRLDVIVGREDGTLTYLRNIGSATSPSFQVNTIVPGFNVGSGSSPALADLDGDGDLDLMVGSADGTFSYLKNLGTAISHSFTVQGSHPLAGYDVGFFSTIALGDFDRDGDVDAVAGNDQGELRYLTNTGDVLNPVFTEQTGYMNPFDGVDTGTYATPTLGDLNSDGDLDVVVGNIDGTLRYFNTSSIVPALEGNLVDPGTPSIQIPGPALGDLDGDGDQDLIVLSQSGAIAYFKNVGTARAWSFQELLGAQSPVNGFVFDVSSKITLGDVDGDADLDMLIGDRFGAVRYFRNVGSKTSPSFAEQGGSSNPFISVGLTVQFFASPSLGDLDSDGDLDALISNSDGIFYYYKNVGSATAPSYQLQTGAANPLDGIRFGPNSRPALGDVDGDGDVDAVITTTEEFASTAVGRVRYYKNTGTPTNPILTSQTATGTNPFTLVGFGIGSFLFPSLGDLNGDGDLDLLLGTSFGDLALFTVNRLPFVNKTIPDQTFSGPGAFSYTVPEDIFVDLDASSIGYGARLASGAPLPAWLSFNSATRTFSGNPSPNDITPLQVRVEAASPNIVSTVFNLTLVNVADNSLVVTTLADENNGNADPSVGTGTSLREAIAYANTISEGATITFDPALTSAGPATILLGTVGDNTIGLSALRIDGNVAIQGPTSGNGITISRDTAAAPGGLRHFIVATGAQLTLNNLELTQGLATVSGGAIRNLGTLNVNSVVFRQNSATGLGGAIENETGSASISACRFISNSAGEAGAIQSTAALTITSSTFTGNSSTFNGGALRLFGTTVITRSTFNDNTVVNEGGALINFGNLTVSNSTFANNGRNAVLLWDGTSDLAFITVAYNTNGGLISVSPNTKLRNSIVAGNAGVNQSGTLAAGSSNNLLNVSAAAAGLGVLADNGGLTQTIALLPGSPAINAAIPIGGINSDQRVLLPRPQGIAPDIGAYERAATSGQVNGASFEYLTRMAVNFTFTADASVNFSRSNITLTRLGTGQVISAGSLSWNVAGTTASLVLSNLLADGNYRATAGSSTVDFFVLAGDVNRDRTVNFDDLLVLAQHYALPGNYSAGDTNYDGVVDFNDLLTLAQHFNTSVVTQSAPATGSMPVLGTKRVRDLAISI